MLVNTIIDPARQQAKHISGWKRGIQLARRQGKTEAVPGATGPGGAGGAAPSGAGSACAGVCFLEAEQVSLVILL